MSEEPEKQEHVTPQPSPLTWSFAKSVGDDGNVYPVLIMHTVLAPLRLFFSAEALIALGQDCVRVGQHAQAESIGLVTPAPPKIELP